MNVEAWPQRTKSLSKPIYRTCSPFKVVHQRRSEKWPQVGVLATCNAECLKCLDIFYKISLIVA